MILHFKTLPSIEPNQAKRLLKSEKGIYFWFDKNTDEIVYIGVATGSGGLKQRIVNQHLNPEYLEYRPSKHTKKDFIQLANAVQKLSKDGKTLQKGIDKSALRKSVGRKLKLSPGAETVNYILKNFYLKIYELDDIASIKKLEKILISQYKPKFNTAHK